jgi:hypothetical protein
MEEGGEGLGMEFKFIFVCQHLNIYLKYICKCIAYLAKFIKNKIKQNVQNSGELLLASQVDIFQTTCVLVNCPILMLFKTAMLITCSPGSHILLNGQMERLNQRGRAKEMCLVAACC